MTARGQKSWTAESLGNLFTSQARIPDAASVLYLEVLVEEGEVVYAHRADELSRIINLYAQRQTLHRGGD